MFRYQSDEELIQNGFSDFLLLRRLKFKAVFLFYIQILITILCTYLHADLKGKLKKKIKKSM